VRFPVDSPLMRTLCRAARWATRPRQRSGGTTVNLVNLGPVQIATIPGEALPNIGYYLKRKLRGQPNMLFGLTNDAFGYIPSGMIIPASAGDVYAWDAKSTISRSLRCSPTLACRRNDCRDSRRPALGIFVTRHPRPQSPGRRDQEVVRCRYLSENGVESPISNSSAVVAAMIRIMTRGTFANVRIKN